MNIRDTHITILIFALLASACAPTAARTLPTSEPTTLPTQAETSAPSPTSAPAETDGPPRILISEVMAGIEGNNNHEFIELYNPGAEPVDLDGWTLWYRLASSAEDEFIYAWESQALLPPHGHYLFVREGQDIGVVADAAFARALNTSGGGLALQRPDGAWADSVGWGNAPEDFIEGAPAPALQNGVSLERAPGGGNGNMTDTDDNAADFTINAAPTPQNVGSPRTPAADPWLSIALSAPEVAEPGSSFAYTLLARRARSRGRKSPSRASPQCTPAATTRAAATRSFIWRMKPAGYRCRCSVAAVW